MIRIGFTGAGGTGKETLMVALSKKLKHYVMIASPVEYMGKKIAPYAHSYKEMSYDHRLSLQYRALHMVMNGEETFMKSEVSSMSERSVIDFLPYMASFAAGKEFEAYEQEIWLYLQRNPYDLLIYLPVEFEPSAEDVKRNAWKERSSKGRRDTDLFIRNYLERVRRELGMKILKVTGTVDDRVNQVMECMREEKLI